VIAVADQKTAALGCVMRDINVGGVFGQVRRSLNTEFRFVILGKAEAMNRKMNATNATGDKTDVLLIA
jgi:hypothetical protein